MHDCSICGMPIDGVGIYTRITYPTGQEGAHFECIYTPGVVRLVAAYTNLRMLWRRVRPSRFVFVHFAPWKELGDWRTWMRGWEISIPRWKNWHRFYIMTPVVVFGINGWIFWGKKPWG